MNRDEAKCMRNKNHTGIALKQTRARLSAKILKINLVTIMLICNVRRMYLSEISSLIRWIFCN